ASAKARCSAGRARRSPAAPAEALAGRAGATDHEVPLDSGVRLRRGRSAAETVTISPRRAAGSAACVAADTALAVSPWGPVGVLEQAASPTRLGKRQTAAARITTTRIPGETGLAATREPARQDEHDDTLLDSRRLQAPRHGSLASRMPGAPGCHCR